MIDYHSNYEICTVIALDVLGVLTQLSNTMLFFVSLTSGVILSKYLMILQQRGNNFVYLMEECKVLGLLKIV